MKALFDTNTILDLLLDRKPFSDPASYLIASVERSEINGYICATTVTTIYYILSKQLDKNRTEKHINTILSLFEIAPVNRSVLESALAAKFSDFEDAVIHESALHAGVEYIITRDIKGFKKAGIPAFSPMEFLSMLEALD
ncbi:MAG TPA: PIN domain-containing protein [Proteobacteria bacterium]|nr:PIN domain-containing protein [Pseudomonadota bacterium]